jgi:hypothetical protein
MAEAPKVEIVEFVKEPGPCHVVEIEQGGVKRRVTVWVDEGAWTGLGWFASDAETPIRNIVLRYLERHALDGSLKDKMFVSSDEAKEIHWGR